MESEVWNDQITSATHLKEKQCVYTQRLRVFFLRSTTCESGYFSTIFLPPLKPTSNEHIPWKKLVEYFKLPFLRFWKPSFVESRNKRKAAKASVADRLWETCLKLFFCRKVDIPLTFGCSNTKKKPLGWIESSFSFLLEEQGFSLCYYYVTHHFSTHQAWWG